MTRRQPLSLRTTLWLAMALTVASTALGAIGLQSYRLHRQAHLTEQLRTQAIAESYAAQLAPRMTAGRRADLTAYVRELAWHDDSRLLAVLGPSGETLTARGAVPMLDRYAALNRQRPGHVWHVKGTPSELTMEYTLAAVPIRSPLGEAALGTLVYAMVTPSSSMLLSIDNWGYFLYIVAIAATGLVLGFLWLKRKVVDPLALLGRVGESAASPPVGDPLPLERDDEIGMLARTLSTLQMDVEEWRQRANRLERSITARVAHATDRITRELKQAQRKIWTDPLTQLGNRRLLDEKFAEIFLAQEESGQELSIVMMDIDNFKPLNDSLGHPAGDDLLKFVGELLGGCLREQDLAVRYGGDEFMLILPSVSPEHAQAIAERTIAMFAQQARLLPAAVRPSISAGIASLQRNRPASAELLIRMADSALYEAKRGGKSRTCLYRPTLQPV